MSGPPDPHFKWDTWATSSPERLARVCEHLRRLRLAGGIEEEVNTMMLAIHLLSWEQRTGQRFPTVPPAALEAAP